MEPYYCVFQQLRLRSIISIYATTPITVRKRSRPYRERRTVKLSRESEEAVHFVTQSSMVT
jgi:hypothetical protein